MGGLLIGVIIFALVGLTSGGPKGALAASTFWLWWYSVWLCVKIFIMAIVGLGLTTGGALLGGQKGGVAGGLLGAVAGGGFSLIILATLLMNSAVVLVGSWLAHTSGTPNMTTLSQFNTPRLVTGLVLVVLGALMGQSRRHK